MCLLPHACLQARKRAPGAIFVNLRCFVQFTLQRSGPNWPFFRGAMVEQSPALRAMTEAGARRRKIEALKTQMEHLKEELQMVVAVEILMSLSWSGGGLCHGGNGEVLVHAEDACDDGGKRSYSAPTQ